MVFWNLRGPVVITTGRQNVLRIVTFEMRVRILHLLAVDIYFLAADFHRISGDANNSLDKILRTILRKNEDNHVASLDLAKIYKIMAPKGNAYSIGQLVHQNMIAYLQGRNHRPGRYLERLNNKGPYKQSQQQSHADGFRVFAERGLGFHSFLGFRLGSFLRLGRFINGHESPV